MRWIAATCFVTLALAGATHAQDARTFRMGFTPFPYDITPEAVADTKAFLRENADIIAFHMESIPWTEALSGEPFREGLMEDWEYKRGIMPEGAATYVAVSPGRDGLAAYWGDDENEPVPEEFAGKPFDDPDVKAAFANYALRAVEYFDPQYLAIGIEVNEIQPKGVEKWEAYVDLHEHVYRAVKAEHPALPVFASFTLHNMLDWQGNPNDAIVAAFDDLMPYNDTVAVSFCPFIGGLSPRVDESFAWLTDHYDAFEKPYVVTETGEAADTLTFPSTGQVIANTPEMQRAYYERVFALAQARTSRSWSRSCAATTTRCGTRSRTRRPSSSWHGETAASWTRPAWTDPREPCGRHTTSGRSRPGSGARYTAPRHTTLGEETRMAVLTQAHHDHFDDFGYMLVEDAVPIDLCNGVVDAIWAFLEMDPDDQDTWYREPHKPGAGMVEMYQHQAMWNVYQHPKIQQVYSEVYGTEKIWVHPDRVNMKPPRHPDHPEWDHKGMYHWDANTKKLPVTFGTQGVLFLTDTADDQGSFVAWPGAHKSLIDEENPWVPEIDPSKFVQVPAKAGTMLIWHRALPHGNGHNTSDKPRLAQYMNFYPMPEPMNEERRQERITLWRERRALGRGPWPGDPRGWEAKNYGPAELTALGRKLLGLDVWE